MSAERFFDDLARTLAESMPRRRAVRVIGASLAAIAIPGVGPRMARAQTGVCLSTTCGKDRRCCQKGAEKKFATYCCPRPSWQFFCGGQDNNYRCINQCTGPTKFPCTALIAHPQSGINGVCCDRKFHSGCVPIGPPAQKNALTGKMAPPQEWKPSCCPKGPGFGFCDGLCCLAPNRCKNGQCRCPDGTQSLDGVRCCKRGTSATQCLSVGPVSDPQGGVDSSIFGLKCCPGSNPGCCGSTCCKEQGCCGTKCCPFRTSRCARAGGRLVCCPMRRVGELPTNKLNEYFCCPVGTVQTGFGCCPPASVTCCGDPADLNTIVNCGRGQLCVGGKCVSP